MIASLAYFFFFSSRRRHTRLQGDWSSDVCSSDLTALGEAVPHLAAFNPSAVELLDNTLLSFVEDAVPGDLAGLLLVEFERKTDRATRGVVRDAVRALKHLTAHVDMAVDRAGLEQLWAVRRLASPALARLPETRRSLQGGGGGCGPPERLAGYVAGLRTAARGRGGGRPPLRPPGAGAA